MNNSSEIVQMLLEDGASMAVPTLSRENARSLAMRHGNCVEKKSKLPSGGCIGYGEGGKKEGDGLMPVKGNIMMIDEKDSFFNGENRQFRFSMDSYETLIDTILSCQAYYSILIGVFMKYAHYFKNQHILIIKEILGRKMENMNTKDMRLKLSAFLVTVILMTSFLFGYLCGLIISWEVGLSVAFTILFVLSIGIALVLIGSYSQEWKMALDAGVIVTNALESLKLLLKVLFVNPTPNQNQEANNMSIIYTSLTVSNYSNNYHAIAKFIENIWTSIEKNYTNFLIRYLKASLNKDHADRRFKRICCLPTFIYFVLNLVSVLGLATLLKAGPKNPGGSMFANKLTLIVFSLLLAVLASTLLGLAYLAVKSLCSILHSPSHNLRGFLKSYNIYGEASTQAFLIAEFNCLLDFLATMDHYRHSRSAVFSFVDATGSVDLKTLTEFSAFFQLLLKNRTDLPICILLFADSKLYTLTDSPEAMCDFLGLQKCLSLPIYLEDNTPTAGNTTGNGIPNTLMDGEPLIVTSSNGIGVPTQSDVNKHTLHSSSNQDNIRYLGGGSDGSQSHGGRRVDAVMRALYDRDGTVNALLPPPDPDVCIKQVTDYLVMQSEMADVNIPSLQALVLVSVHAQALSGPAPSPYRLADLATLAHHWPFLHSYLCELVTGPHDPTTPLSRVYQDYLKNMLLVLDQEPAMLLLSRASDLSYRLAEDFLCAPDSQIGLMTIREFSLLSAVCHLENVPMQSFIKCILKRANSEQKSKQIDSFYDTNSDQPRFLSLQTQTLKSDVTMGTDISDKSRMTPKSFKRTIQGIKDLFSTLVLSEMTLEDVIWMIGQIKEITSENVNKYQERIREINLNGLVLATCDVFELRSELNMSFGDWHLFKTLINYLRTVEENNDADLLREVAADAKLSTSSFNPLTLLSKTEPFPDRSGTEPYDSNSNEMVLSDDTTQCKICYDTRPGSILNSDTDSVWKRKASPYGVGLCKDHFLSPVSVSAISSPKMPASSEKDCDTSNHPPTKASQDMSTFYSATKNRQDVSRESRNPDAIPGLYKSDKNRESKTSDTMASFYTSDKNRESKTPDTMTGFYASDKSRESKTPDAMAKFYTSDKNRESKTPDEMSGFYSAEGIKEVNEEKIAATTPTGDILPVRTKSRLPRDASFESTTTFSTQLSSPRNSKMMLLYEMECADKKPNSYSLPHEQRKKRKKTTHASTNAIEQPAPPTAAEQMQSKFQSYLRKAHLPEEENHPLHSSLHDIDREEQPPRNTASVQYAATVDPKKCLSQNSVLPRTGSVKVKRYRNKKSSKAAVPVVTDNGIGPDLYGVRGLVNNEPDIIFRSKSYCGSQDVTAPSIGGHKHNRNHHHHQHQLDTQHYHYRSHGSKNGGGGHKERNGTHKKSARHKSSYAEALNNEISHSEI